MFKILILLIVSAAVGFLLRRSCGISKVLERTTPVTVFMLLFIFGMSIGSNGAILSNLHSDGVKAGTIAVLGVVGSIVASAFFKRFNRKGGEK